MKVFISADLEGISGVVHADQTRMDGKEEYQRARRLMTGEVNAAIEGALAGGATAVVVNDGHGPMRNILIEDLNPAAELITGAPKPLSMMQGIDQGFDVAFLVGYHAQAGTTNSILDHTISGGTVYQITLNGKRLGETGLNAGLAGSLGVPVVLVTCDKLLVEEAKALLGENVEGVAVKESFSRVAAKCLPPQEACRRIREAASRALQADVQPFVVQPPLTVTIDFMNSAQADMAALIPGSERVGSRRVQLSHDDYMTLFKGWRAMIFLGGV